MQGGEGQSLRAVGRLAEGGAGGLTWSLATHEAHLQARGYDHTSARYDRGVLLYRLV